MTVKKGDVLSIDALREIASIASGNAATGLSKLLNKKIDVTTPKASVMKIEDIAEQLGGAEKLFMTVLFRVVGDVGGTIMMMFETTEAHKLANILLGRKTSKDIMFDEMMQSTIKEIGNIMTGSYLMALSDMLDLKMIHTVPSLATDMLQAILDAVLAELALKADEALVLETDFSVHDNDIRGHILFLPEEDGIKKIMAKIHMN